MSLGLSPLPGDSAFNTPIISLDYTVNESAKENQYMNSSRKYNKKRYQSKLCGLNSSIYCYSKTKPEERLKYFLPDWFNQSYVCDYGCHRGDFAFKLFELFHLKINRLDGIDVRKNCILNAQHMQREKYRCEIIRRMKSKSFDAIDYSKINFKMSNWVKDNETFQYEESEYDIIIALGVTKLVHLYYGDIGLEKFLRRSCHRLKPGGHLIVELQSRAKYIESVKDIGKPFIVKNFKNIKIQPDKLEPLLASVGFPYCCKINTKQWNKNGPGDILLCTKPIGTTPVPIRDTNTTEMMLKYTYVTPVESDPLAANNPPPVIYNPGSSELLATGDCTIYPILHTDNTDQLPDSTISD